MGNSRTISSRCVIFFWVVTWVVSGQPSFFMVFSMSDDQIKSSGVSLRAYARHRKVALSAVQKAIRTGRITITEGGKINIRQADAQWAANTDIGKRSVDTPDLDLDGDGDDDGAAAPVTSEFQKHRTDRERIRKEKEQHELDKLNGTTIDLADAQRIVFTSIRTIRDAVMNVPVRIKDLLAAETDPTRIESMLESELAAALEQINIKNALKDTEEDTEDGGE